MMLTRACLAALVSLAACKFAELPPIGADGAETDATASDGALADSPTSDAGADAPTGPDYAVGGAVAGMWSGASVALEISAPPNPPERVTVTANGTFSFPTRLPPGRSFSVSVPSTGQPFMHQCTVQNPNASIVDADVLDRQVDCSAQVAVNVALSAPFSLTFDANTTAYSLETADGVQETRVRVTAPSATAIAVNGTSVLSGSLTAPYAVDAAPLVVHVAVSAISQDFTFNIERTGHEYQTQQYAKSSNSGAGDQQGFISASGNLVAVGVPLEDSNAAGVNQNQNNEGSTDSGAVYIYRRDGLAWTQEAYLKASMNAPGDRFGASVSLVNEGSTAVLAVGAPFDDGSAANSGAVYVFRRSSDGSWSQEQRLKAVNPEADAELGSSVSLSRAIGSGLGLAIGSRQHSGGAAGIGSGAAYVFRHNGTAWSQERVFKAPNAEAGDHFGERVAFSGDVLAVAAPDEDSAGMNVNSGLEANNASTDSGAVYVYRRSGTGTWGLEAYVKASNTGAGDRFGAGLSIEGGVMAVGAPQEDSNGTSQTNESSTDVGALYMLRYAGGSWSQEAYLKPGVDYIGANFGTDVCVRSDLVIAGAPATNSQGYNGFARYFQRQTSVWVPKFSLLAANDDDLQDGYGSSVSLSGEGIYVSAPFEDSSGRGFNTGQADNGASNSGAVYGHY